MEDRLSLYIIAIVAWLLFCFIIACLIANEFSKIAAMKGHKEGKWFWLCLIFGIVGWLMIIALPDRRIPSPRPQNRGGYVVRGPSDNFSPLQNQQMTDEQNYNVNV